MIVHIVSGDIFNLDQKCKTIVNTVAAYGEDYGSLTRQFKERYPHNYIEYQIAAGLLDKNPKESNFFIACRRTFYTFRDSKEDSFICNAAIRDYYEDTVTYDLIDTCCRSLALGTDYNETVAMPALGCGRGGLDFDCVADIVKQNFKMYSKSDCYLLRPH